jgi:hypothetical protein
MSNLISHTAAAAAGAILATTGIAAAASQHIFTLHQGDYAEIPNLDLLCDYVGPDHAVYCFRASRPHGSTGVEFKAHQLTVIDNKLRSRTFPRNP